MQTYCDFFQSQTQIRTRDLELVRTLGRRTWTHRSPGVLPHPTNRGQRSQQTQRRVSAMQQRRSNRRRRPAQNFLLNIQGDCFSLHQTPNLRLRLNRAQWLIFTREDVELFKGGT